MRTIQLNQYENSLNRQYLRNEEVLCVCDTSQASFSVILPDCDSLENVIINFVNVGNKLLTVQSLDRQNISGQQYFYLLQWQTARLYSDSKESRYLFLSKNNNTTFEGGVVTYLINKTGAETLKGEVVCASSTTNNAVQKIVVDVPDPIGVFYLSGIADGALAPVIVSGIADVYFVGNVTRKMLARGFLTSDGASYVSGRAIAEAVPTSPFATDKHFYEIGHALESRTGAGLAKCDLHFN